MPMGSAKPGYLQNFLTPAESFYEITRGKPYELSPEERAKAGLTPETWRLTIVPDEAPSFQPGPFKALRKDDGSALALADLEELFRRRPVRCLKTMQCLLDAPSSGLCSNGLWEGVALRDVLARLGRLSNVRRLFYTGFHREPQNRFASSLSLSEVLETPPGRVPVFLALRLNGRPLPIERGGPVRMLVPEAYGFKSIKWLERIVLTNDYRANDSYAEKNNDPQSPMKTLARIDVHGPSTFKKGETVTVDGVAVVGASGLRRVEYWLRRDQGTHGVLAPDDPAWASAEWKEIPLPREPAADWGALLPGGRFPEGVHHVDPLRQRPLVWPVPFSWIPWTLRLEGLEPWAYELRMRAVDLNGFAQPEPRPNNQSGIADVPVKTFVVTG
jgi:DMSO/TMAO reductase YedYZ molybdopterin-dependent catalytic subunit